MPSDSDVERLASLLERLSRDLSACADGHWSDWFSGDAERLRRGDLGAAAHVLKAFGGMGSVNDLVIEDKVVAQALEEAWALARAIEREIS